MSDSLADDVSPARTLTSLIEVAYFSAGQCIKGVLSRAGYTGSVDQRGWVGEKRVVSGLALVPRWCNSASQAWIACCTCG